MGKSISPADRVEGTGSGDAVSQGRQERVLFANQLRGIAALMVVGTHLLGVYFEQTIVSRTLGTAPLTLARPEWTTLLFSPCYNPGPLAVALFFLISGFVIPFSLRRLPAGPFLLSRAMRIYPTYWACLGCGILAISLSHDSDHLSPLTWPKVIANALLIYPCFSLESLDLVNWTLVVELKFYLLAAMFGTGLSGRSFLPVAVIGFGGLAFQGWFLTHASVLGTSPILAMLNSLATDLPYLTFMLIGTLFYKHHQNYLPSWKLLAQASLVLALFALGWSWAPHKALFPKVGINYVYATVIFATAYLLGPRCKAWKPLEALASISYPLYAVHSVLGYALLQHLIKAGWTYNQAFSPVVISLLSVAYCLHRWVERPSQQAGKRWAQSLLTRGPGGDIGSWGYLSRPLALVTLLALALVLAGFAASAVMVSSGP